MNWICSHCGEKFSRFRTRCPSDGQRVIEDLAGLLIGGRYRIRELIGVGGMDSTVWKAWQTGTERVVAVKVLPAADEAAAKRFARGARIAANLNHPNCTVVHDYGRSDDGKLFLVMEFLSGQVLQDILGPEGMAVADTLHVADQVLQALEHAHAQRAVHRDLKPDNLFLCKKNDDPFHVKILDFGIAKYVEEDPEHTASREEGPESGDKDGFEDLVTEQRQVCGTPQYMAPEQVVGARIDGRTDLYSLGCVIYRMLTGRLPFDGKTRYELYQKHLQEAPRPFAEVRPDLVFPERLELIVMKALAKRPDQRFQGAAEMRKALETVELNEDRSRRANRPRVSLKHTSPQERSPHPTVLPGPAWTLSAPSVPPPLPGGEDVGVTVVPPGLGGNPLVEVDPNLLGKRPPPGARPVTQGELARVGSSSSAGAVVLSPSLVGQVDAPRAARTGSTGLLSDAVVRHPASRSPLAVVADVPRSSETEPNRLAEAGESRRRRIKVAAVLAAAFCVGVGGVALVMRLLAGPGTGANSAEVAGEAGAAPDGARPPGPGQVSVERRSAATAPRQDPHGAGLAAPVVGGEATRDEAPPARPEVEAVPIGAVPIGAGAGGVLSAIPLGPSAEIVPIRTSPAGAEVRAAGLVYTSPCALALAPGSHRVEVSLVGYLPASVDVVVPSSPARAGRAVPVEVALVAEPVAPPQRIGPRPVPERRTVAPDQRKPVTDPNAQGALSSKPEPPQPDTKPPADPKNEKPTVRLLDDGPDTKPTDKKPTVRLLGEDGGEPKKPQVKVLGD